MNEETGRPELVVPGDIYEDPFFHPCLCIGVDGGFAWGISLLDGTYPRTTDLYLSGIRRLTIQQAWEWKMKGPEQVAAEWKEQLSDE